VRQQARKTSNLARGSAITEGCAIRWLNWKRLWNRCKRGRRNQAAVNDSSRLGCIVFWAVTPKNPITLAQAEPALQTLLTGQLLVRSDKRNPVFAVDEVDSGKRLLVFYDFDLIEIVESAPPTRPP